MDNKCVKDSARYIIQAISDFWERGDGKDIDEALALTLQANTIFVYGVGRSGLVGKAFAMRLVQMGLDAYFIGETITPIVKKGDLVFLISNLGQTFSAIQTAQISQRIRAKTIILTSHRESKLSRLGDVVIVFNPRLDKSNLCLAPLGTLFEDGALILLDGMISALMKKKKETDASLRDRHAIWV
jgi:6-phospho-3-hexuloisomerase